MSYAKYSGISGGGSGTVTSVGLADGSSTPIFNISGSPVTGTGTLTETLKTQTANTIFSGPTSGGVAQPTFRALVVADLPLTFGNLTDAGTDGIVVTGGTGAVIGAGTSLAQHVADSTHNGYLSSVDWTTFNNKQSALTFGNLTDVGTDGITVTGGTGAVIGSGTSLSQHVSDSTHNGYLSSTDWSTFNGKQAAGNYITALTGDVTATGPGSVAATLVATTNATLTTLSGLTTATNLVSVGTITTGTWSATTIALNKGGTGQTTKAAAFDALSPLTTGGDLLYGGASGTGTRLANGTSGQVLQSNGTTTAPSWTTNITGNAANVTGTVAIANGGTGQTTKAAAFDALSPMTTGGDIIYGGASGTGTRLANGSSGQVLTSAGGTSAPTWAAQTNANFGGGLYHGLIDNGSASNFYSVTNSAATNFTVNGTPTITEKYKSGFATIGQASSNAPGITLTAPITGTIKVMCHYQGLLSANNGVVYLTDGSNNILDASSHHENAANSPLSATLFCYFDVTATTSYTFKIRGSSATGALQIGGDTQSVYPLAFIVEYVK